MLRRSVTVVATLLSAGLLLATTALADLRSPEGTAALGSTLSDEPALRSLIGTAVVDALLDDARTAAPEAAALLPLLRPIIAGAVDAALEAPAGRAALAATLTDATRQLTFDGPIVVDLRAAVLAAADAEPEPLATLARTAAERGAVGLVVLGETADGGPPEPRSDAELARVGGLAARTAIALAWALLLIVLLAASVPDRAGRPDRLRAAGGGLLLAAAPMTLLVRLAPEQLVGRIAPRLQDVPAGDGAGVDIELIGAVLPALADGMTALLAPTADVALLITAVGVVLVGAGVVLRLLPGRR